MSNWLYKFCNILITIIGVAVEQIDVKPTISLNNMVTSSWVLASMLSPEIKEKIQHLIINQKFEYIINLSRENALEQPVIYIYI